jgi:dihydrofolate reductase
MHVSLDGFVCGSKGEMDWIKLDNELWDYVQKVTDDSDTALYGANTFKLMESYWPTAAQKPNATKHDVDHAKWANESLKLVFSNTLQKTNWQNTKIVHGNIKEQIMELKNQSGKNLLMLGSPSLAHSFMKLGLIDELWLNVNPVVIGSGMPLFKEVERRINLKLIKVKSFASGVVGLNYEVIH